MAKLPLPVHSYQHVSRPVGVERLVNCFAEKAPPEGKAPAALMRAPGIVTGTSVGNGPGRGLFRFHGELYAVSGTTLYKVSSGYVATSLGTVNGTDIVSFAENPTQFVICDSSASYYSDGSTVTQITDADFNNGVQCCALDSYILFRTRDSGQFFSSDFADASSYDALMYATAEGLADDLVGIISDHRQLLLLGEYSTEIWYNAGTSGFPFARDANGFLELGCAAGATLARIDNSVYWLASDLTVRRLDGLTPVRISQHGVEQAIATYAVADAYAFTYSQQGHIFYVLTFPSSGHTWVYDATTTEWHERQSYGLSRWRPCSAAFCYGLWFVQDYETGKVGTIDTDTYTDWDDTQRLEATFPSVYNNGTLLAHGSLSVMAETGVGNVTGQGTDPQMTLELSNDGGRTWRTQATKSLGLIGQYKSRVKWDALGSARDRVYRISISDPVKVVISDAQLRLG